VDDRIAPVEYAPATAHKGETTMNKVGMFGRASTRRLRRLVPLTDDDSGMSTAEYAVGTIAAAAFAAVLYVVVTGAPVVSGLAALVTKALSVKF
jgi:hypothetical protein